jgi:hypothetical protein
MKSVNYDREMRKESNIMNEFIEKDKRLLHFYCKNLRSAGFLILILGSLSGCAMIALVLGSKYVGWRVAEPFEKFEKFLVYLPSSFLRITFLGIGILGLVQFIRYLVERDYKPGWILRHGDMILYLYALLTILSDVWVYMNAPSYNSPPFSAQVFVIFATVFSAAVRVLILVGLGQVLRRILPVIEESKTLV